MKDTETSSSSVGSFLKTRRQESGKPGSSDLQKYLQNLPRHDRLPALGPGCGPVLRCLDTGDFQVSTGGLAASRETDRI